jgi:hypothetical protein
MADAILADWPHNGSTDNVANLDHTSQFLDMMQPTHPR